MSTDFQNPRASARGAVKNETVTLAVRLAAAVANLNPKFPIAPGRWAELSELSEALLRRLQDEAKGEQP